jgi:hypothetical protein
MALRNNAPTSATPAFEADDDGVIDTKHPAFDEGTGNEAFELHEKVSTAVAAKPARTLPTAKSVVTQNVLSDKKNAFHVEWDSVPRISAEQGSFTTKGTTEEDLGTEIHIELMSYQSRWVASPNDKKADAELVKYSEDGITSNDGTDLKAHLADLKDQGYGNAKIAHRCIIVGELVKTAKGGESLLESLIQVDLPESGRKSFEAYQLQASWAVGKGRKTAAQASDLTLKAVKDKTKSGEIYTKIVFS